MISGVEALVYLSSSSSFVVDLLGLESHCLCRIKLGSHFAEDTSRGRRQTSDWAFSHPHDLQQLGIRDNVRIGWQANTAQYRSQLKLHLSDGGSHLKRSNGFLSNGRG